MWIRLKRTLLLAAMLGVGVTAVDATQAAEKKTTKSVAHKHKAKSTVAHSKSAALSRHGKPAHLAKKKSASMVASASSSAWKETQDLAVRSGSALVVDQAAGDAIFHKNASAVMPIASITKLMTAMVVLDSAPNLQAHLTIAEDDVDTLRGSRSRLHVGSVMSREVALLLALMSSENRAAHALARNYPGGMPAFIAEMNLKAQALGMRDTHFEDPTGLTSSNVSTANDLVKMVVAAYRYPLIREFTTTSEATVDVAGRELAYRNTNPLVKSAAWDVGLSKTGYIHEAGKCLVMQARVADKPVVIVLLDSAGKQTRVGDANRIKRWMESTHAARKVPTHAALLAENVRPPS
ncbi:D-alanyl-D-alanine endopeptidase [Propionivibrio sp.]|uniref:D-alanyl-D-alanine endopeptidase n=1 Tax=Propionivibrio sp. TaxID=2212460 RepID=UPI0025FA8666|nr:D-alanyl-D-alanine endopeptidase [Propionivibrio sp.]MBK7354593.1 D-alanyl-D-alanine endopeptidase [Propionivibrio sp.]MBK8401963.1 D-alanyl-D-alanine endopeptidase [Propionivibrio sp.]MBK8743777.1 D-alanyl-D-alanine endopeptidase [Propionivibrio sp.]MBK8895486.1 D-alanyl-D-alanine endopeptidase [Propionivibrio sp.]MBL0206700.1 D-alanyl-D-alanine endopeptidase [Propionivibrio sp.]